VVVVRQDNRNILIDGFARARALRRLGKDTVWALMLAHSEAEALLCVIVNNKVGGQRPSKKLGSCTSCTSSTTAIASDCGRPLPQYKLGFPSFGASQDAARSHSTTGQARSH